MSILRHSRPGVSSLLESLRGRTNHTPLALGTFPYDLNERVGVQLNLLSDFEASRVEDGSFPNSAPEPARHSSPPFDERRRIGKWKMDKWTVIWPT